jgi:hypothetical protein
LRYWLPEQLPGIIAAKQFIFLIFNRLNKHYFGNKQPNI